MGWHDEGRTIRDLSKTEIRIIQRYATCGIPLCKVAHWFWVRLGTVRGIRRRYFMECKAEFREMVARDERRETSRLLGVLAHALLEQERDA